MRFSTAAAAASLASSAMAFPAMDIPRDNLDKLSSRINKRQSGTNVIDPAVVANTFDPKAQYVSTSGQHVYKAPGPLDARGPCPVSLHLRSMYAMVVGY
jgi:hypothetical protein